MTNTERRSSRSQPDLNDEIHCHRIDCAKVIRVENGDTFLICKLCKRSFHRTCSGMSAAFYDTWSQNRQAVAWFCVPCQPLADDLFCEIRELKIAHKKLEKDHLDLVKRVEKLEQQDPGVEGGGGDQTWGRRADFEKKSVSAAVSEWNDISFRKPNLIMFGVSEIESENFDECKAHDKQEVAKILAALDAEPADTTVNVRAVVRIGAKSGAHQSRILKVVLGSEKEKLF